MKEYHSKCEVLEEYLKAGLCMVHVDSRRLCQVPPEHRDNVALRLNISYRFKGADIVVDDDGIQATLTFGGQPYRVVLPWPCVYAVTSMVMQPPAVIFEEDVPAEVRVASRADPKALAAELEALYDEMDDVLLNAHRVAIAAVAMRRHDKKVSATKVVQEAIKEIQNPSTPSTVMGSFDPAAPTGRRFGLIKGGKDN